MSEPTAPEPTDPGERSFEPSKELISDLDRVRRRALPVAVIGAVLCAIGAALYPTDLLRSYLVALVFWLSIAAGCTAVLMLLSVYPITEAKPGRGVGSCRVARERVAIASRRALREAG